MKILFLFENCVQRIIIVQSSSVKNKSDFVLKEKKKLSFLVTNTCALTSEQLRGYNNLREFTMMDIHILEGIFTE